MCLARNGSPGKDKVRQKRLTVQQYEVCHSNYSDSFLTKIDDKMKKIDYILYLSKLANTEII